MSNLFSEPRFNTNSAIDGNGNSEEGRNKACPCPQTLRIKGVSVSFPHTPYRPQLALMYAVVTAVTNRSHALVESPTGTGKSLALLCSTLAMQAHLDATAPPDSRTHEEDAGVDVGDGVRGQEEATKAQSLPTSPINQQQQQAGHQTRQLSSSSISHTSDGERHTCTLSNVKVPTEAAEKKNSETMDHAHTDSDDSDFQPAPVFRDVSWQNPGHNNRKRPSEEVPQNAYMLQLYENPLDASAEISTSNHDFDPPTNRVPLLKPGKEKTIKRVPRIFYATRTHSQVAQVVDELRKTPYRPRMTILASRREYCLHPLANRTTVSSPVISSRDEMCKRLVADMSCSHFFEAENLAASSHLMGQAWDIEELSNLGRSMTACPYYASHHLYQDAQLILCPYSFLVDPIVREARGINLAGDIVILDEAHNIENYARDAASFSADVSNMRRIVDEVDTAIMTCRIAKGGEKLVVAYRRLKTLFEAFLSLVDSVLSCDDLIHRNGNENAVYDCEDLLKLLQSADISMEEVKYWRGAYDFIVHFGDGNDSKRFKRVGPDRPMKDDLTEKPSESLSTEAKESPDTSLPVSKGCSESTNTTSDAYTCLRSSSGYGPTNDNTTVTEDCEATVESMLASTGTRRARRGRRNGHSSQGRRRRGRRLKPGDGINEESSDTETPWLSKCMTMAHSLLTTLKFLFDNPDDYTLVLDRRVVDFNTVVTLSLHCLNAAVCFREVSGKARSVVVASGTLSPMKSFAGELGTAFEVSKALPHVVDVRRQLYIGVVGQGANGVLLEATFHSSARFEFQDGLGETLLQFCRVIPGGVLVFFPSYRLMSLLHTRWRNVGILDRLLEVKGFVACEPSQRGDEFDAMVTQYEAAARSERGALLLAVCRGKLSEGIDFRDETSRAVILIGIPFPYKGDIVIEQKRRWNDRTRLEGKRKDIQGGAAWYEMQAFRALNQALGRVVRHRYDYGAILLMDVRFRHERVLAQLPKWTREAVGRTDLPHEGVVQQLEAFYKGVQGKLAQLADMRRSRQDTAQPR